MKQTIVITGANRGLGLSLAKLYSNHGYRTIGITKSRTIKESGSVIWETADLNDIESLGCFYKYIISKYEKIDIYVNNAAIYRDDPRKPDGDIDILSLGVSMLTETLRVNYLAAFIGITSILPHMIEHKYGRVINVSSGMGRLNQFDSKSYAYRTSKLLLNTLTICCSKIVENMDNDVAITSICPGWMCTDMGTPNGIYMPSFAAEQIYNITNKVKKEINGAFFRNGQKLDFEVK